MNKITPKSTNYLAKDHIIILKLSEKGDSVITDSEKLVNKGIMTK